MSIIDRRNFCSLIAAVSGSAAASGTAQQTVPGERAKEEPELNGFPTGNYTPFGYLDNPWHTWDLSPGGVLRSLPGIGFGWYYPAGPGGYFSYKQNNVYTLELSLGFEIAEKRLRSPKDFAPAQLSSPYHTKNILSYQFTEEEIAITSTFVLVNENALAALVEVNNQSAKRQSIRILAVQSYRLGGANWWGRDGLAGNFNQKTNSLEIRSFAAGPVCATTASAQPLAHFVSSNVPETAGWFDESKHSLQATSYYPEPLHGGLRYELSLEANSHQQLVVVMAKGANTQSAGECARLSLGNAAVEIARKRAEDHAFWREASQLTGDWPQQWKHGWVYDFETLRMMVRQPRGVYKHAWDAMQIQAPRNVLAETSIDMWALSYAAPELSKAVFLGQFQDALEDNIPCMREDGVMNMVAADGSECGTAISWCYPFFCAASIYDRTEDLPWLRALYPGLARLLKWTIANRVDAGGFLVGKCSWETGMDASKRFLINQPTGGELTEFVRLSELQAAAAQAGAILARFAELVSDRASIAEWKQVQATFTARTQTLWKNGWFRDFDSRTGRLVTDVEPDPAQSAALFCGVANADQTREALLTLHKLYDASRARRKQPAQGWDDGLAWSSLVLPYLESVWSAGDYVLANRKWQFTAKSRKVYTIAM